MHMAGKPGFGVLNPCGSPGICGTRRQCPGNKGLCLGLTKGLRVACGFVKGPKVVACKF